MGWSRSAAGVVGALGAAVVLGVLPGSPAVAMPAVGVAPTHVHAAVPAASTTPRAATRRGEVQRHKVHLVLVRGPRGKDGTTLSALEAAVRQVNRFYVRSTGGRIRFKVGKVHGWVRAPGYCDNSIAGQLADRFGWQPKKYVHVVAYQAAGCGFAGEGSWGGKLVLLAQRSSAAALAHELGHNLGLGHAGATTCSRSLAKACTPTRDAKHVTEYADLTDVMGAELGDSDLRFVAAPVPGTLNPALLRRLHAPVHETAIDPSRLASPRSVLLTSRTRGGYTTAELRWAGRKVWLSYQPPRVDDGKSFAVPGWYRPALAPQVVMHAKGPQHGSMLIPRTSASDDGAGLPVGGTYRLPGGATMRTELVGDAVRLTFVSAD